MGNLASAPARSPALSHSPVINSLELATTSNASQTQDATYNPPHRPPPLGPQIMAPPKNDALGMLALPTEVQQAIIDEAGNIKSVRQVCRELAAAADRAFLEKYFTERRHLLTPCGLHGLVEFSANARLRSRMQSIQLAIPELREWECHPALDDHHKKNAKKLNKELRRKWDRIMVPFRKNGEDMRLLAAALLDLGRAGVSTTIELEYDTWGKPFGVDQLERHLGMTISRLPPKSEWPREFRMSTSYQASIGYNKTVNMLLRAIAESRYPLSGLKLEGNRKKRVVDFSTFAIPIASAAGLHHAMPSLKKLVIGFGPCDPRGAHALSRDFQRCREQLHRSRKLIWTSTTGTGRCQWDS